LKTALDELNKMVGLKAVKDEIRHLVDLVSAKYYDHLLRGGISLPTFTLNRVFLGNPGTGKTTVAKLYGRILKDLGILTDGGFEIQHSKDLIGASDGESHTKIGALLERCNNYLFRF
jgi:Holliday junction resolvasome RuvABC ATP-dependent DNA helicase subunit